MLRITREQIARAPPTVAGLGNEYLDGLVKLKDQLQILLDIDKILGKEEAEEEKRQSEECFANTASRPAIFTPRVVESGTRCRIGSFCGAPVCRRDQEWRSFRAVRRGPGW